MGKSFEFKECERFLKRVLKDKGIYSKGAVIAFLITGGIGFFAPPAQAIIYVETDLDSGATGASSYSNGNGNIHLPRNSVVFAPIRNGNVYGDLNRTAKNSVIIGAGSYAHGIVEGAREEKFTAVGNNAHVAGGQGTAIGSNTFAMKQATAVGNDVYAAGDSSIAIGNDDISTKYKDSLSRETLKGIFGNGESNNPAVAKLFREGKWYSSENDAKGPFKLTSWSDFNRSYLSDGTEMYSPTYAGGVGAIAIGSRSIAYKDGSTAIGTLSYAFGEGSTAMGLRAYTAENAKGAVAIGEQSRSFAPQSLAVGNRNESTDDGAMSYGYSAKAVGKGSLAFGYKTYANASIANNIAAADGHSATNPLRQAVRSKLGNYSEAQLAALETYQNKAREYYAKIDARASEAAIAAAKTAMDNAKADVDAITLTDVNAMALVDGGQVSHQSWNTVGNTIKSVVDAVEDKNATNKLTVEKLDGVYLTTKDEDGNTQTVQKSKKSGDNAIAIGYYASAKGTSAIAEGSGSVVDSLSGIGIGSLSYVSENSANSIAVGVGAQVRKENSIAIGTQSQVFGAGAIGMGPGSRVMGDNSIAMGYGTDIRSVSSIGLGVRAKIGYGSMNATGLGANVNIGTDAGNTVALGSSASIGDNSLNSMAVGYNANVANNTPNSIAFGTRARIAEGATSSLAVGDLAAVTKASSTALGRLATADFENSVALGYRSTTHYWGNPNTRQSNFSASASATNVHGLSIDPYLPQGSTLGTELAKLNAVTAGYVSVGGWDEKGADGKSTGRRGLRRIVNVAPGALDTDAVTVAQLRDWTDKSAHFLSIAGASNKEAKDYPDINDPMGTKVKNAVVKIKSNFDNDTATGTNALALGVYAYANGQKSVAMGPNAYANVDHGVAIGDNAQAWSEGSNGNGGVAIGKDAKAYYWNALALGTNSNVSGWNSLAMGANARVGVVKTVDAATGNVTNAGTSVNDGVAIGRAAAVDGASSIALGAASKITTATNAVAIGPGAQVLEGKDANNNAAAATGAVALGSNANVTGSKYSVALGLNSAVEYNDTKAPTKAAFTNEDINDPGNGVVSVGNNGTVKRRIINVASGVNDNDAVTVKQLRAVAPKYYSVNTTETDNRTVNGVADVKSNINNDGATAAGALAVGSYTKASGNYSTALGRDVITSAQLSTGIGTNVTVSGEKSVGIGSNVEVSNHSAVAIGLEAKSDHARGIAVGYKVNTNESDTFAGGSEVNVTGYGSVGIGKKVETRANNAVGIGASTNALGSESIALGYAAYTGYTTTKDSKTVYNGATEGIAVGKEAVVESNYAIAIGGNAKVKRDGTKDAESSVAIGAGAKVTGAKYSVALGLNSQVNSADTATKTTAAFSGEVNDDPGYGVVSVGQSGKYRRILNVAGGVNDNDAVNVKQLRAAAWGLKTQSGTAAAADVTPDANGKVTLKAGNNVTIDNANGVVTVNATGIQSVSSGNTNALGVTTTNGAVTITPNLAGSVTSTGDANKLVTAGVVNTALNAKANVSDLAAKLDKTAELHVRAGDYTVGNNGEVSLIQEDASGTQNSGKGFKIKGLATKGDITNINNTLGDKADKSYVDTQIGTVSNLGYKANGGTAKQVAVGTGLNFVQGDGTATTAATAKAGIEIVAGDDGKVTFGLNEATRNAIDNAASKNYVDTQIGNVANKNLSNLNDAGKAAVKDLAAEAVKVAQGKNVTVTPKTKDHVTTYTVDAIDTTVAAGEGLSVTGGDTVDTATNKRNYTVALSADTQAKLAKVENLANTVGTIGADGRDGKAGTGKAPEAADATAGDKGLTGKDGLNGKDLTTKVNALRNGEAGTVVYTDENGNRLAKANDGQYYPANKVNADGTKAADAVAVATPQARLVNPTGSTTTATKLSNIADGDIKAGSTDAINGGQLHTELAKKADVTALDGKVDKAAEFHVKADTYKVGDDGVVTVKQEAGTGAEATDKAFKISGLATKTDITNINNTLNNKANASDVEGLKTNPITFTGDDAQAVTRALGTTLTVKGAENFTPSATNPATAAGVNIRVEKDPTTNANGLVVKLADTLTNMKGISGNGTDPLTIKNGDNAVITVKPGSAGAKGEVDFGGSKLTNIGTPGANTDAANKAYVDTKFGNAANKDLDNLNDAGKAAVKDLAAEAVKVAQGKNVTVTPKTTDHVTTYTVDAIDTTVAAGEGLSVTGGDTVDTATNKRNYTVALSQDTKDTLAKVQKAVDAIGTNGSDGRDGKPGTGADAGMGKDGLTKEDGLNGKDLTTKVNALRNGEAGSVVYTDENGNRVVKAKDGKWYLADKVGADGTKAADAVEVTKPQARLVNPDGTTTGGTTKLSNIADGNIAAGSTDAINGGQLHTELAKKADVTALNELADKPLTFSGDTGTNAARKLGETLAVKGAANFTPAATATPGVNIQVASDPTNGLTVSLADTLTNMKGISGNGADPLTIKNGDNAVITVKPGAAGTKGDVDFGGSKLTNVGAPGANTDAANKFYVDEAIKAVNQTAAGNANLGYKANGGTAKTVAVTTGLDFVQGDGTANTAESAKSGIEIVAGDSGKVIIGLSNDAKTKLDKVNDIAKAVGANGVDGRDGKPGTGADAGMGKDGLTAADGLNGKDLTTKVNALRNGEAGSVVYTDENGKRVVKANDGKWYPAGKVNADGTKAADATEVTAVQARLVNPDGTTTGGTTKLSNIADGEIKAGSKDAINGGQLHDELAKKADVTALAGKVDKASELHVKADTYAVGDDGVVTVKQEDGTGAEATGKEFKISGLATKTDITTINTALGQKANAADPITFTGDDAQAVTRALGTTLTVKGAENFTPSATNPATAAGVNIRVEKDPTTNANGLVVKLADTLTNMKGISGNGTDPLTIKNGDNVVITVKPGANGAKGDVDFGGSKLTNVGAPGANTDAANKFYVDEAIKAVNQTAAGNANLGYKANGGTAKTVAVTTGLDFVQGDGTANTAESAKSGIEIVAGDSGKVIIGLSNDAKTKLDKVNDIAKAVGANGVDGRDGKPGTGADAGMGKDGLTAADGLNGKDLTTKVNALRNGEAGSVVYTDENGNRVVKANDGKWYPAGKVNADGTKAADAVEVTKPQARLVNPDGTTTGGTTKLSNIADGTIGENSKDAINGGQLHTELAKKADVTALAGKTNTSLDNLSTAGEEKVKDLAAGAVKVAAGKNVTVTPKTTDHVTTYTVDAIDTTVAAGEGLEVTGGTEDTNKVRAYTVGLSQATKDTLAKVGDIAKAVGANGVDGRDGKPGTGADAGMGKDGLTKEDGLNGKDLTTKVNALRNGEAGTVVYTDENGNRVVKANDGKWYPAGKVNADGTKAADATEVTKPQARLVNPDGTTTGGTTKLSNIADGEIKAGSKDAINGGQLHTELAKKADVTALNELADKPLTFSGDTGTNASRKLGETLAVKGAANFTPAATATPGVNIQVASDPTNGLTVSLADTLTNMKGISGNGTDPMVIKNGDQSITITPTTAAETSPDGTVTKPAQVGKVDFGTSKITSSATPTDANDLVNKGYLEKAIENVNNVATGNANLGYKANGGTAKTVAVTTGLDFVQGDGTANTAESAKSGIEIVAGDSGKVIIGLSNDAKTKLDKVNDIAKAVGANGVDGRDGKPGTGADAGMGKDGLTAADGLNGKDLTTKVNALRNGEAGSVVYTDENGNRVVKANDGKWYPAGKVNADGTKAADATEVTAVQARLVNPDGTTTTAEGATGTKLSNIANGTIADKSKDAVNGGQLYTAKQELANALGGNATVGNDGTLTKPAYNITKDDAAGGTDTVNNVGAAVEKLDARINTVKENAAKPLTFKGDDNQGVERKLDTTLTVKGATNFTPSATTPATEAGVNIRVEKDPTTDANGLVVKLADTLTNMKGISGNGTDPLTIKNGDNAVITVKPGAAGAKGDVDFGGSKLTNVGEPGANTDAANKAYVDTKFGNAANKDLDNLNDAGKNEVRDLAASAVKVGAGKNVTVTPKTADHVTTYTVDAIDTTVAAGEGLSVTGGDTVDTTTNARNYTVGLSQATKDTLAKVSDIAKAVGANGANGIDGRDGKSGTGADAGMGKDGLTGADGLNGKDLTTKVNALRNGEAGSVVYTDENGNRVVKANDGKWYPANKVNADGTKAADAVEVTKPQARLVNTDGTTSGGTTVLNNVASAIPNTAKDDANQPIANPTFLDRLNTAAGDANTQNAAVNVSDLNSAATEIIAKGLTFQGNDKQGIKKQLGETLDIVGEGTVPATATTAANNIRTKKADNKLEIGLAKDLVGITSITNAATTDGAGTKLALDGNNLTITNTQAVPENAPAGTVPTVTTVTIGKDGINAGGKVISNVAAPKANTDAANKEYVDTKVGEATAAATGNAKIGYKANAETETKKVGVADGLHFKSGTGTIAPTDLAPNTESPTKDTDSKEAKTGIAITTEENGVVNIGLDEATRKVIDSAAKLGDTATDGRDGKAGTGKAADDATAVAGDKGLTGQDGLNGKDLTSKVNALRNGEAGTVVYTDDKGNRVVKANDGKWYDAKAVNDKGELKPADQLPQGVTATPVDAPQARLVNPDGTTTTAKGATGTKLSNIADGTIGENSKDAINGGQLHTELAKKADVTALNELAEKALTFSADTGTNATRKLGTTLAVKGAANFTPAATATPGVNIQVASDPTNGLTVSLADTLTNMKGISGNGTDPLTIKNGDNAVITVNPGANGAKGDVDFGGSKLTNIGEPGANTDAANKAYVDSKVGGVANLGYKANGGTAKTVAVTTGLDFVQGDGTANTAEPAKAGIEIVAGDDGKVTFGLNEATRNAIDNAANKDLGNLSDNGKNAVKDLAAGAVKVAAGKNVAVTPKTTDHVTTYTVDAIDTKVIKGDGIEVTGGAEDTDKVRTYTVALSQATKDTLAKVADIAKAVGADGANGIDGRDGKSGTGNNAGMGKDGLTGADGLNGKDLTTKVNALRNGEAGTVVYTDENGNRVVKASDGKWYPADKVKADGTKADDAVEVKTPQARLVNPDGSTTGGTTVINNVASAIPAAPKDNANSPFLDRLNTAAGDVNTKHAAVNVSDLNSTATEIIAKGLTFQGDDVKDVTRALGTTLTVKGAKNFTPSATTPATEAGVNIRVEKDSTTDANGLVVKLADTLTDMKGISGNGTDNLVIKNGTNTITVTPGKAADGATKADPGKVNFGDATVTVKDLDAPITYRTNGDADEKAKTVSLKQGLDFVTGDGTTNTAESAKPGLNIVTGENGKVIIGLSDDAATKLGKVDGIAAKVDAVEKALDNKADKSTVEDLANKLADKADKATVKGLADKVDGKADKSTVADLAKTVEGKADKSELDKKADKGEVTALANKAMTFTGNKADETVERKLGETLHLVGTNNITVEKDATKEGTLNVTLASTLTGMESITTKAVDGLSNTTWDPTKVASAEEAKAKPDSDAAKERSKAATQGQLKDVADRVSKGRVFTADTKVGDKPLAAEVGLGDTLAIQGGATSGLTDNNIGVELAPAKDGKPATMTVKLAKDLNMADGKSKYDRYLPEFEKTDKGLLKLDAKGNPIPKKDKDGNVILQKDGNGNPIVNSSTVVNGNGTTYTVNNLLSDGKVQVDNANKPVAGLVTTTTAAGTRYEERLTTEDGHVIFKQDDNTKELKPVLKTVSVVDSRGIRIGSNDKPVVSLTKDGLDNGGNTISNVAPGVYESDAATVGQLNAATNTVTAKVNEAGAHAAALAAMNPLSYDPLKKSQVMAGVGAYKGNKALALGVAHYANEDTMFNVGVSVGGGENMMNAGVTYRFGGEDSMIPERYKGGPISSVYILQDEVSALKAENAQVKADNEQVKADNARMKENYEKVMQDNEEMKAQIKMLMAHMGIK
ncbi:YadA-like family protein [Veillonella sp. VA137]|uniref:YadA-like family protein n=1 Tax=Veillonella sp. VA137 TaxID=741828 RepID=UPI0013E06E4C|nr:YadA-like family protein [Veillonella sp. VA137]